MYNSFHILKQKAISDSPAIWCGQKMPFLTKSGSILHNFRMESSSTEKVYALDFVSLQRKLNIRFSSTAPYEILGWEESYQEGSTSMTTTAKLKKKILLDYWNFNHEADASYRKELMLDF